MKRPVGFTLIELLVVVSIIVLLIAILLPSMSKSREAARRAVCGSQLHQAAVAVHAYSAGNKLVYPPPISNGNWPDGAMVNDWPTATPAGPAHLYERGFLPSGDIFYCPSNTHSRIVWGGADAGFEPTNWTLTYINYDWFGGGYRSIYDTAGDLVGKLADGSRSSTDAVLMTDNITVDAGPDHAPNNTRNHLSQDTVTTTFGDRDAPAGGNVLFNDGSTRWRSFAETELRLSIPPAATHQRDFYF